MQAGSERRVDSESVLRAQGEVAKAILAAVKGTNDPAEARLIVEFGKQAHVGLGTLLQERPRKRWDILQVIRDFSHNVREGLTEGLRVMNNWE